MPAADEVWRLQREDDPECLFFRRVADHGHYQAAGGTRQGIYAISAGGVLLGSLNSLDPAAVASMLKQALKAWEELPIEKKHLAEGDRFTPRHRWEMSYPEGGLILEIVKRDLPDSDDPAAECSHVWNRDHAWFTRKEARAFLPARPSAGAVQEVPRELVERLARFHVVDNVIGQTLPFARAEVADSRLQAVVLSVNGSQVKLRLEGEMNSEAKGPWLMGECDWKPEREYPRGIRARLLGFADYDLGRGAFTRFELLAHAQRWGFTGNNGRARDPEPGFLGVVMRLAPDTPAGRVPPAFIDVYDADWVIQPD